MESIRRVVIVTGGGMGVGKEIAKAFADNQDYVVICGRHLEPLQQTAAEIETFPGQILPLVCNVADAGAVENFVEQVVGRFHRIDVLVNNAGVYGPIGLAFENDSQEWLETLEVNLFGVFLMTKYVVPQMIEQGGGVILNLSGGGATSPKPRYSAYAASKAGVVRFTEVLAQELAEYRIRVNSIAPGFIATRFHQKTLEAGEKAGSDLAKVREKLQEGGDDPRLSGELAVFLASEEAEKITGRLISSVWDDWRSLKAGTLSSDLYTLRRIDNAFFQEVPRR